jgi:hypothetical protein
VSKASIQPVVQSVTVSGSPVEAFRHFTDFERWWPRATHSVGGSRVRALFFEPREGGKIYEEHIDGRRFQWGVVQRWKPSDVVEFTWHPSREESTGQTVTVAFEAAGEGTRVTLIATDWERWGAGADRARRGYSLGWRWMLNYWAGIGGPWMWAMSGLSWLGQFVQRLRGGTDASIARARGELRMLGRTHSKG